MNRTDKLALVQRSLGLRHKLKVHDSMKTPETHEDLALLMLSRWELEDELKAIEEILADLRAESTQEKKMIIERDILKLVKKLSNKKKENEKR
jgi:hypothetical protein